MCKNVFKFLAQIKYSTNYNCAFNYQKKYTLYFRYKTRLVKNE